MSTTRNRLHQNKLTAFTEYLVQNNWTQVPLKSEYEVLRMRSPEYRDPLIVYRRDNAKEHLTTHGVADKMLSKFLGHAHYDTKAYYKPTAEHASDDVPWE